MAKAASKPSTPNPLDFLTANAGTKVPKGKATHPELSDCGDLSDKTYVAYKTLKDAEAAFSSLESQVLDIVRPEYEKHTRSGDFAKTFNVAGTETPGVQISFKDMFKKIPLDREAELKDRMGDKYDTYFFQKRDLSLTDTSDETITLLLEKLGPDTFKRIFKIEMSVGTKPDLDRKQFELPEDVRMTVEQYKPALKIRVEK